MPPVKRSLSELISKRITSQAPGHSNCHRIMRWVCWDAILWEGKNGSSGAAGRVGHLWVLSPSSGWMAADAQGNKPAGVTVLFFVRLHQLLESVASWAGIWIQTIVFNSYQYIMNSSKHYFNSFIFWPPWHFVAVAVRVPNMNCMFYHFKLAVWAFLCLFF